MAAAQEARRAPVVGTVPLLRRAWTVLRHHGLARRHVAYPSLRHRPRGIGLRTERRTPRVRHGERGRHRPVARALGSLRRDAARTRHDPGQERGTSRADLHAPDMYRSRAVKTRDGSMWPFEDVPTAEMLEMYGAHVVESSEAQLDSRRLVLHQRRDPASHGIRDWTPGPLPPNESMAPIGKPTP